MQHLLCLGYGYVASHLHAILDQENWQVTGTKQSLDSSVPYLIPYGELDRLDLTSITHILISIPTTEHDQELFNEQLNFVKQCPNLKWLAYLSVTSVYGNANGDWVDESHPLSAITENIQKRIEMEQRWLEAYHTDSIPSHIFRLTGIYGPGRSVFDRIRKEIQVTRILKEGHVLCRIHVDDLVRFLQASMEHPTPGEIYNLGDDLPAPYHEVIGYGYGLLQKEPTPLTPYEEATISEGVRHYYQAYRRVSNKKAKARFGLTLRYPTFKEGLKAVLEAESHYESRP